MKKILISFAIIGAVAAVVVGGTGAFFSDTEASTGNTFTAGNLDLLLENNSGDVLTSPLITAENLKPGSTGSKKGKLKNNGSIDGNASMSLAVTASNENTCQEPETNDTDPADTTCGEGTDQGELCQNMNVSVVYNGDTVYDGSLASAGASFALGSLKAGKTHTFSISYSIPTAVGNEIQSDGCEFRVDTRLDQTTPTPTPVVPAT